MNEILPEFVQSAPPDRKLRLYEAILDATPDLVYVFDLQHRFTYANQALLSMWGRRWDEAIGKTCLELGYEPWHAAMHDEEIARVIATRKPVRGDVPFDGTGGRRIYDYIFVPVLGPDGEVEAVAGTTRDVTDRKRQEEHQQLLINELNHRVKNTLAVVQSMALQTLKGCDSVALASARFEARIMALSKAHEILTRKNWKGASLDEVVAAAVAPCMEESTRRFEMGGPSVHLSPRRVLALSMALHELCTNAVKYGSLSNDTGKVRIEWRVRNEGPQPVLELLWRESGGPPVTAPGAQGFGTRLVERGLRHDLAGSVLIDFLPDGVTCRIEAPLEGPIS